MANIFVLTDFINLIIYWVKIIEINKLISCVNSIKAE